MNTGVNVFSVESIHIENARTSEQCNGHWRILTVLDAKGNRFELTLFADSADKLQISQPKI